MLHAMLITAGAIRKKKQTHGMFQGTLRKNETYEQYGPQKQSKTYPSVIKHVIYMESTSYR